MKVLQINSVCDYGSTGRIARDMYDYLESQGHECVIAFGRGDSTPGYNTIKIGSGFDQSIHGIYSRVADRHGFSSKKATIKLVKQIANYNPDIIQLHNVHGYYLNIEILFGYLSKMNIPVVWLLHDQWAVSGHSAYFELNSDGSFPKKLSNRQELKNYPKTIGISQFGRNLADKERIFTSIDNMTVITPSDWLSDMIRKSFLGKCSIKTIHNGVDTNVFRVDNSNVGKLRMDWKAENKIVILGIASVWDKRKGLDDFIRISEQLPNEKYQIVLVGIDAKIESKIPDEIICINKTNSVKELRDIYNAGDVFLNPTYFDNFPTVNIEALACGTPVITYDTGGSAESIDYKTGSVINQGDIESLVLEITRFGKKNSEIEEYCRNKAEKLYSKNRVYSKYIEIYREIAESVSR